MHPCEGTPLKVRRFAGAVNGLPWDCTAGPVAKAVIRLGIPMILVMSMESVLALTDIFFVGGLGSKAVATIGLSESLLMLVYAVAIGVIIGATAMRARRRPDWCGHNRILLASVISTWSGGVRNRDANERFPHTNNRKTAARRLVMAIAVFLLDPKSQFFCVKRNQLDREGAAGLGTLSGSVVTANSGSRSIDTTKSAVPFVSSWFLFTQTTATS
jgi:hypothetical protein